MTICAGCGHENRHGVLYCEECANPLLHNRPQATIRITDLLDRVNAKNTSGSSRFEPDFQLMIYIQNATEPLEVLPQKRLILGRHSRKNVRQPDIDLTPYDALRKGVSKIHLAIACHNGTLTIADMDSVNGTYLNGERLPANVEHVLHDGDEICMGKLVLFIYFQKVREMQERSCYPVSVNSARYA